MGDGETERQWLRVVLGGTPLSLMALSEKLLWWRPGSKLLHQPDFH